MVASALPWVALSSQTLVESAATPTTFGTGETSVRVLRAAYVVVVASSAVHGPPTSGGAELLVPAPPLAGVTAALPPRPPEAVLPDAPSARLTPPARDCPKPFPPLPEAAPPLAEPAL